MLRISFPGWEDTFHQARNLYKLRARIQKRVEGQENALYLGLNIETRDWGDTRKAAKITFFDTGLMTLIVMVPPVLDHVGGQFPNAAALETSVISA